MTKPGSAKRQVVELGFARETNLQTNALSDEAIALACAAGDAEAIAELFHRFRQPVARYLYRLVSSTPDVEDLLQGTFLEVARGACVYDAARAGVLTWLLSIATNKVRHLRRATARRMRLSSAMAWLSIGRSATGSPDVHATEARCDLTHAQRALSALPDVLREAFVACELEGLSAREAASVLDTSEAAVWKRVSRARSILRQQLLEQPTIVASDDP